MRTKALLSYFLIPHEPQIEFQCGQIPHLKTRHVITGRFRSRQIKLIFNQKNNRNWHRWHNAYLRTKWLVPKNELISDFTWKNLVILKIHQLYWISNSLFTSSNCRFFSNWFWYSIVQQFSCRRKGSGPYPR